MRCLITKNAFGAPIYWRGLGSSTMRYGWRLVTSQQSLANGTAVALGYQLQGRGQQQRRWYAPWGQSLLLSVVFNESPYVMASALSLRVALGVAQMLEHEWQISPQIKWPNDLLVKEQKICGILTEIRGDNAVVGIGINCLVRRFPGSLQGRAISLQQIVGNGTSLQPRRLLPKLLRYVAAAVPTASWRSEVAARLWRRSSWVSFSMRDSAGSSRLYLCDIAADGSLITKDQEGKEHHYYAGEIALC